MKPDCFTNWLSAAMRRIWVNARLWAWHHGGERIAGASLYFLGHSLHWRERHSWLNAHGPVQALQRGLALFSLVIGIVYACTGRGASASPLADRLDQLTWPMLLLPHQWFGLLLAVSSLLLLVAIYEWPMDSERMEKDAVATATTESRLANLLRMQLCGHMMAFVYWSLTGMLLIYTCHTSAGGWASLTFSCIHSHLYIRNNREYEKEKAEIGRAKYKAIQFVKASQAAYDRAARMITPH